MRAVVITQPGGPEVLRLEEVPDPVPGPGEVLVAVAAAGLNRADVLQRQGHYPPPPGSPPYPGMECSGRIIELGPEVAGWQVGDEVCALLGGGAYAEQVAVPQGQLLPVPDGVSLVDAAALPEATCTIQGTVYQMAHLAPGETFLVHGGAGGVGTFAIQIANAEGCTVACTAGSPEKLARCRELGADLAISYRDEDFTAAVLEFTGWHGADVILDIMGAPYLARNLDALATWGRLVGIATRGGSRAEVDLGLLMLKRATIVAATLRTRTVAEKAEVVAATREHIWPLISAGKVVPVIHAVLPMSEAAEAHRMLDDGSHIGKILLVN
jgi:putative PIG3 family NAD(P)H quinone oxidoreductase